MTWRSTAFDAARIELLVDPPWLLAPLFVRRDLPTALLPDWSRWWSAAVSFRPGGAAPRQENLIDSPALAERCRTSGAALDHWLATRPIDQEPPVEQQRLDSFTVTTGDAPAPRRLTVLVVPFGAPLFLRPEPDRLVVDAVLRLTGDRYRQLLDPVFADFF